MHIIKIYKSRLIGREWGRRKRTKKRKNVAIINKLKLHRGREREVRVKTTVRARYNAGTGNGSERVRANDGAPTASGEQLSKFAIFPT